jgi:ABC-type antimicrobial peptide transport system permease subunit
MALGATSWDATSLMMTELVRPVLGGIAAGLLLATGLSRALASQLYGLSSIDPVAFGSAVLLMIGASTAAAWLPARRAARVDPVVALRAE